VSGEVNVDPTVVEVARKPSAQKTYVVWSPDGETPPVVPHKTHPSAHFAAHQMAKKHPGKKFFVMATAGRAIVHAATEEGIA
jgi:hypothetical protein